MTARIQDERVSPPVTLPGVATVPAKAAPSRRRRQAPEWLVTLGVGLLVWLLGCIPQWRGSFFYYNGDANEQVTPLWHALGDRLRAGEWVLMDPASWMGGNYAGEALIGLLNPVALANMVLVSFFDNLSVASFVVMVEFLGLLAMGVYLLTRSYGARRWAAVALAVAIPFSGFTLWYDAAGWIYHLMAFTWVAWFWWASHRHTRRRLTPILPFVFGALAMTTGSPFGALGVVVVLAALGVELLAHRRYGRLLHLVVVGLVVAAAALPVYLPLLGAGDVTWRASLAGVSNDTFLVPDLGDLAGASSPTYLPSMTQWAGAIENKPSAYLAWFALPLLPWLRWDRVRRRGRLLLSPLIVAGVFLLATLAPSSLWLFRWPMRMIDYLYLAVAVLLAVALSAGLARTAWRRRALISGAIVAGGAYLSWATRPIEVGWLHLVVLLIVAALVAAAVLAARRSTAATGAVLVAGTAIVLTLQASTFPYSANPNPVRPPFRVSALAEGTASFEGTVLQLANGKGVTTEQYQSGEILFGNVPRAAGYESLSSYTGIGFKEFSGELCMDYRGATCSGAFERLWQRTGGGVTAPLADTLRVSTLVLQRSLFEDTGIDVESPRAGWHVADEDDRRVVWVRDEPLLGEGRVSWASDSVAVLADTSAPALETVRYSAADEGRLLFARLAWPGYTATVDGEQAFVKDGPAGLVSVDVPAGEHTLTLSYSPPGLRTGLLAAAGGAAIALVQAGIWWWQRRRHRLS
ncbi:YfhO family protein [Naasia sp. SYSU D00057]|uniref:YfhO family protein n=1 Tax=Naasia sp. SYSU D00057 TaxID=2817380 RepID=UPI001B3089B3|nr:YfhO family protein [Naasia sp. SYSU D00057]